MGSYRWQISLLGGEPGSERKWRSGGRWTVRDYSNGKRIGEVSVLLVTGSVCVLGLAEKARKGNVREANIKVLKRNRGGCASTSGLCGIQSKQGWEESHTNGVG
jgi:coenzyme F420-reducing hydrogenase gamma subunit